jgi:non-canonical purine NTP pyrophosphatase (RdgB/HAM1 family)
MRELIVATGNKGKFAEFQNSFRDFPFKMLGLKDLFPEGVEIEEPGETLEGNALIKAMTIGKRIGKLTLADDTGLEIDALNGGPGVKTARFAPGTDEDRWRKLLEVMKDVPDGKRGGQMRCVIAIYDPERDDKVRVCSGIMKVHIAREPRGTLGFGYDSILFNEETQKMHAEETVDERNQGSHRGKALAEAKQLLLNEFV